MLPLDFLRKLPEYHLKLEDDDTVRATLVEHEDQLDECITELRSRLGRLPLVGFDLKTDHSPWSPYEVLILYVEDLCLLIKFDEMSHFPMNLSAFLEDRSICFVGMNMKSNKITWRSNQYPFFYEGKKTMTTGVDIRHFAAKVLKNSTLSRCSSLEDLANRMGFDVTEYYPQEARERVLEDFCLSDEDVKYVINRAYISFKLGAFLRKKLEL